LAALPEFEDSQQAEINTLGGLSLAEVERRIIISCLQKFDGNKKSAAQELGVTTRTLSNKLKQYREQGFSPQLTVCGGDDD
jgi:DNA-binding NtrC family response regulator